MGRDIQPMGCSTTHSRPEPLPAQAALGVAVEYYLGLGPEAVWDRVCELASLLRTRLAAVPGVTVHDAGRTLCGIVAFTKVLPQ